jgi:hypothetical protein
MQTVRGSFRLFFGENVSNPVFYNVGLAESADYYASERNAYFECSKGFWPHVVHEV